MMDLSLAKQFEEHGYIIEDSIGFKSRNGFYARKNHIYLSNTHVFLDVDKIQKTMTIKWIDFTQASISEEVDKLVRELLKRI